MKILNDTIIIHDKGVNDISECNLRHAILNYSKQTEDISLHNVPMLYGCMNTHRCKDKFNNVQI